MRIIWYELKKMLNYRAYIFILVACLAMSVISVFHSINESEKNPKEYREFFSEINSFDDDQKEERISELLDDSFSGNGRYSPSTVYPLSKQYKRISGYSEYLDSIEEQCQNITGISIFADKNSFSYKNAEKTETAYKNIKHRGLPFDVSEGIELALINKTADILMLFLIFVTAIFIFTKDREVGIMNLLYSYPKGRTSLCISKISTLFICSFIIGFIFLASGLIIGSLTFGLGDLTRPIQSVNGFIESNIDLTVYQYIIISIIFKSVSLFVCGLFFAFICIISKNSAEVYAFSALIVFIEYKLYNKYGILSEKSYMHDINILSFIKPENYLSSYRNLNINENPINLLTATIICLIVLTCILAAISVIVFSKVRIIEFKKISHGIVLNRTKKVHSLLIYDLKKLLILQKSIVIFAIWMFIICGYHGSFSKPASVVDMYYKNYTTDHSGTVNSETDTVISVNNEHFKDVEAKAASGKMTIAERREFDNEMNRKEAFEIFKDRCDKIRNSKYNTELFYDTGYKRAFGVDGYHDLKYMALLIMSVCVLMISPMIAFDKNLKMTGIIYSTSSGKIAYLKRNSAIAAIICFTASACTFIPYFCNIIRCYGSQGISLPVQSLTAFCDFPSSLNIWQFALFFYGILTLACILLGQIMLIVSYNCKSRYTATLINATVFVFPIVITIMNARE